MHHQQRHRRMEIAAEVATLDLDVNAHFIHGAVRDRLLKCFPVSAPPVKLLSMSAAEENAILSGEPMTLGASGHRALALALFLLAALIALASRCAAGICNAATLSGGSAEVSTANKAGAKEWFCRQGVGGK
ncbi:MAG: hypothetical protein ACP5QA_03640 [Phycisphaerae bacterium]